MSPEQKKILLVEDEKFSADLYARQLTNAGLAVSTAYDGISGFKFITTQNFDLVLLDIMLPGMNGLELLKEWKTKNPQSTLPVLLLTNLGQEAVIKEVILKEMAYKEAKKRKLDKDKDYQEALKIFLF